jgi:nucleotide-binding universal stress UspA family protein
MPAPVTSQAGRIVVGVDGSASSRAALRWAVHQAEVTGGIVDAIIAWQIPAAMTGFGLPPAAPDCADMMNVVQQGLQETVREATRTTGGPPVRRLVIHGPAGQVLVDASAGADLLVLGSRGHAGFAEALLGSVGQHCVHRARCPVVIVRTDTPAKAA